MNQNTISSSSSPWVHIIGAGVSGLSLAAALADFSSLPGHVILSDPTLIVDDSISFSSSPKSQTFCFWYNPDTYLDLPPECSWDSWSFSEGQNEVIQTGKKYRYGLISGQLFRTTMLKKIQAHPQIHLKSQKIHTPPSAQHIFDSRPPHLHSFRVKQSFVGLEVECTHPHNLSRVGLMNDLTPINQGVEFRYLLPLSKTRLLVEYTCFTTREIEFKDLERRCSLWLKTQFGDQYREVRKEAAHIPMGLTQQTDHLGVPIGARAGMTRDSTGYGFLEMRQWAKKKAQDLISSPLESSYQDPPLRRWMDSCLLNIIEKRPDLLPSIFMTLGQSLSGDHFARFMMQGTLNDSLWMIRSAPKVPFLLSALHRLDWLKSA